ncbi:hypothetical protein NQ318_001225 [Aromia moschata]|uniref:Uncharacterized protein n=1 Tax=Aromia moschata TaxID=1265417 RepID=A0AAV8ZFX7_9CUCU|nr:hypothetical protein NQ318_001225 [Aromia moschata]
MCLPDFASFNMSKVYAKIVSKFLTHEQKEARINICADILNNIVNDPGLLAMVITCDESSSALKWTRIESVEAVKTKATEVLNQLTEADFQHCFQQWKSRMERCRDRQRQYEIEGEKVGTVIGNEQKSVMTAVRLLNSHTSYLASI